MNSIIFSILLILSYFVVINNGANILALFPMSSRSHTILGYDLCETLAKRGHNVTHVSAFPRGIKLENYDEVNLIDFVNPFQARNMDPDKLHKWNTQNFFFKTTAAFNLILNLTETVLQDQNLQKILHSNQHYDVIIMGIFAQEALLGIGHHFKAPIIATAPNGMSMFTDDLIGNPAPYSYVPNIFFDYTEHMTFYQRLVNTVYNIYINVYKHIILYPAHNDLMHKYFPNAPDIFDLMKNVAIVLSNSHESISYPRPIVPNIIQVGGMHVSKPKQLPDDLQQFMDDSLYGIIYFSLGTNVHSRQISNETKNSFVRVFSKLKYDVLWKWDEPTIVGLPENVRLSKWYPQSHVLAHPKTKLFITHGGLLSTTETLVRGVPLVGIPMFADQFINMKRVNDLGFGVILDFENITEESVTAAINEILGNKKYYQNVKKRSALINDRIVPPLDEAVYWVEYVIRHKGAPHLRSAGADIPMYQYLLLDVIVFILFILTLIFIFLYIIIRQLIAYLSKLIKLEQTRRYKSKME